jgi:hypothetical protein
VRVDVSKAWTLQFPQHVFLWHCGSTPVLFVSAAPSSVRAGLTHHHASFATCARLEVCRLSPEPLRRAQTEDWCKLGLSAYLPSTNQEVCCGMCDYMCGGASCHSRPGGSNQCCAGKIRDNNNPCDLVGETGCIVPRADQK